MVGNAWALRNMQNFEGLQLQSNAYFIFCVWCMTFWAEQNSLLEYRLQWNYFEGGHGTFLPSQTSLGLCNGCGSQMYAHSQQRGRSVINWTKVQSSTSWIVELSRHIICTGLLQLLPAKFAMHESSACVVSCQLRRRVFFGGCCFGHGPPRYAFLNGTMKLYRVWYFLCTLTWNITLIYIPLILRSSLP